MLRASGVCWDLRKAFPYDCYDSLEFSTVTGYSGDSYSRYLIRVEEMRQSIFLVSQCCLFLIINFKKIPNIKNVNEEMEKVVNHYKIHSEGLKIPMAETYIAVEAPKGEFGVYLVAKEKNRPTRCKIRPPGFFHLQGLDFMLRGHYLADVATLVGTQDIVFGEVDR